MKELISKIYSKLGIKSQRTQGITKHVLLSFIYRGGSIASSFLLVPLTINYLDTENYGIWLTLSSFIGWFAFFDIGLGHGLRNKFSESKAQDKLELAQAYVSTAYFTIGSICLGLIFLFLGLINLLNDMDKHMELFHEPTNNHPTWPNLKYSIKNIFFVVEIYC